MSQARGRSQWLDWQPSPRIMEKSLRIEPTKPAEPSFQGFAGSNSGKIANIEPRASSIWATDFGRWLPTQCRFVDGYWSPTRDLHADFIGWNVARDCDRAAFETLLKEAGVYIETQGGMTWCYGLTVAKYIPPELARAAEAASVGWRRAIRAE